MACSAAAAALSFSTREYFSCVHNQSLTNSRLALLEASELPRSVPERRSARQQQQQQRSTPVCAGLVVTFPAQLLVDPRIRRLFATGDYNIVRLNRRVLVRFPIEMSTAEGQQSKDGTATKGAATGQGLPLGQEGYLDKESKNSKWNRRYFVLEHACLRYYKDKPAVSLV